MTAVPPPEPAGSTGPTEPTDPMERDALDLDVDPALATAVLEIEKHLAESGWDQPARLYALVDTASLVAREPALAAAMGLDQPSEQGSLTAVEQDQLDAGRPLEQVLEQISWPDGVAGCAAMVERLVLPPGTDADIPEEWSQAQAFVRDHPDRQEVRIVAGATRHGATYCALRMRAHDDDGSVLGGTDLVPELADLLAATLTDDLADDPADDMTDDVTDTRSPE